MASENTYWLTRFYFQRALGTIYFFGFLIALNQFRGLCGKNGILPMPLFIKNARFWDIPSLFWINQSDGFIIFLATLGLVLSLFAATGFSDSSSTVVSVSTWASLWVLYMSFVNMGQTFYGFGWEVLLLEAGFLAIFLGPAASKPSVVIIWLLRWLLFRLMFGAGLIKIRGDECWRDLTCMKYHYETMPLPSPTSWYFHQLPMWFQKISVLFNHFVELIVPLFYFASRPYRHAAGILTLIFQLAIISTGNFSWLNHVTLVITLACFDDSILPKISAWTKTMGVTAAGTAVNAMTGLPPSVIYVLTALIAFLSINPAKNLFSSKQIMNTSFEPLHIVNTYGAFGSITRTRDEIVIEGSYHINGPWLAYEFKGKPGDVSRRPPFVSPYHYKIDWQMWFAAMGPYYQNPWIINLVAKLLQGEPQVIGLLEANPFPGESPKFIRASLYEYHYADGNDKNWWKRDYEGVYLPPLSLDTPDFRRILNDQGWLP